MPSKSSKTERKETKGLRMPPTLWQHYKERAVRESKRTGYVVTASALARKALEAYIEVNP